MGLNLFLILGSVGMIATVLLLLYFIGGLMSLLRSRIRNSKGFVSYF